MIDYLEGDVFRVNLPL